MCRLTGTPIETRVSPDEYKSRMAPPINPRIATSANGIKYQVGSKVVSAPIGSDATRLFNSSLLAASSEP
ncbi:unannotated protein [freshwater metagenome]|uniref:Unannotated protein n=1 Tax=freshwater metagenome TaxID=449393 RepID=A0A6J6RZ77_9ZZZZ